MNYPSFSTWHLIYPGRLGRHCHRRASNQPRDEFHMGSWMISGSSQSQFPWSSTSPFCGGVALSVFVMDIYWIRFISTNPIHKMNDRTCRASLAVGFQQRHGWFGPHPSIYWWISILGNLHMFLSHPQTTPWWLWLGRWCQAGLGGMAAMLGTSGKRLNKTMVQITMVSISSTISMVQLVTSTISLSRFSITVTVMTRENRLSGRRPI